MAEFGLNTGTPTNVVLPTIPANFNPNTNLDKSKEEITFLIDDVLDIIRNISENSTYVKGKFGNSISMVSDDFLEKTNGLATFTRDSFTPAVDLMKDYEEYLEIVQNYDENIYKNKLTKLEEGNLNAMRQRVDTIAVDGGGSNNYFEIEDHMISETPMTLEDYVESLKTLKNAIEQLGEHNIVAMPVGDGPAEINLDSNVDEGEEITF